VHKWWRRREILEIVDYIIKSRSESFCAELRD
jgi:hypothetical protein